MAVVGKVGTYAQVQPIQGPDFGKMVKDQFDKMDAEDKAAKAAKAKADKEKQDRLDKLSLGDQETLNIDAFNVKRFEILAQKRDRFAQLKKEGKLNEAKLLIDDLSTEGNAVKQANATLKEIFDNESKYDPTYVSRAKDLITNLNSANVDIVDKGNGDIRYTIYADPEKKEVLEKEITVAQYLNKIRLPYVYEPTKEAKLFASTFKLDEIEKEIASSGKTGTIETIDLLNNPRVLGRISKRAEDLTKDDRAMAHFGTTIDKFETRANAYTKEEKDAAKAYFEKNFKDAYAEEVNISIDKKSGRGGSGGKDAIKPGPPALYLPESIKPEGAASEPLIGAKTVTISNSSGKTLTVGGMPMDRVLYNPGNGQLYIGILYSASGKESLTGEGTSAGISESNKTTKWFTQNSDEFDKFKATYNAAFGKNLQTIEDFKNELFL
jgi:hypothetical protein